MKESAEYHRFTLTNSGEASEKIIPVHKNADPGALSHDIYRLSVDVSGDGWSVQLLNALASLRPGESEIIPVYISVDKNGSGKARVTLTAQSESDPSKTAVSTYQIKAGKKIR